MKSKIYKNREVLRGNTFKSYLNGRFYQFKIVYVNEKGIKIKKLLKYSEIGYSNSESLEGIVKNFIIENSADSNLSLSRKAYMSSTKLKKIPLIIDNHEFKIDQVTNSYITLGKFIEYDDLLENKSDKFIENMRNFIFDNLLENPPVVQKRKIYGGYYTMPYLFGSGGYDMNFRQLGHRRTVVSESELERNREKHKELREKSKKDRDKMKKLDEEINSNKKVDTRELARYR